MYKIPSIFLIIILLSSCSRRPMSAVSDNCKDLPKLNWQSESRGNDSSPKIALKLVAAAKSDSALFNRALSMPKMSSSIESSFIKEVKNSIQNKSEVSSEFWQQDIVYRQSLCFLESQRNKVAETSKGKFDDLILELIKLRAINVLNSDNVKKKIELKEN